MNESIDELRSRWEADPSPQVSLQLAEEYRRLDRREDAIEVLAKVLDEHPQHVASRVAIGRYRLEMGETEEARSLLEQVATEDPTHLVAGKLLIRLYLEIDDTKQARDRLDLYKLLNEGDPDIEEFEQRLRGEVTELRVAEERIVIVDVPRNGDPFGDLLPGTGSRDYWLRFAGEGIFPVAATGLPAGVAEPRPAADVKDVESPTAASTTTVALEIDSIAPEVPEGATVTLANLYLQQGHLDDAEEAFVEILEREPENREARAGLEETRRRRTVESDSAERPIAASPAAEAAEVKARKVAILRDYLQRLRAGASRD